MNSSRAKPATLSDQEQLLALMEKYQILQKKLQPVADEFRPGQDLPTRLRVKIQTGRRMMKKFDEDRARLAQQMYGLSHTIVSSHSQGKAAMFLTPCYHCPAGGCI